MIKTLCYKKNSMRQETKSSTLFYGAHSKLGSWISEAGQQL